MTKIIVVVTVGEEFEKLLFRDGNFVRKQQTRSGR